MNRHKYLLLMIGLIVAAFALPLRAQENDKPQVNVKDQVSTDKMVWVDSVYSEGPGFIVIHIDNNGAPGGVAGYRSLNPGWNYNIGVELGGDNMAAVTPTLYAMLHVDDGKVGTYEFDGKSGLDNPVKDDAGKVITPSFKLSAYDADDQFADGNKITIGWVVMPEDGFVVIHKNDPANNTFGGVIGYTAVKAGTTNNIEVDLTEAASNIVWPMLHVDDGTAGKYEFDGKSGLDNPVVINGKIASDRLWTEPHVRVDPQIVTPGDGMTMAEAKPSVYAESVLSKGPGWLVIHKDDNGKPGGVAGYAAVKDGYNEDVEVELDPAQVTPMLWPMLHVDDGAAGKYEFDGKSGLDNPVKDSAGNVITFPVEAAPSITYTGTKVDDTHFMIDGALIDEPGWLALHADNGKGQPGPVIGVAPLLPGWNQNIVVTVTDASGITDKLFPMLHYDSGKAGAYEFDGKNGLDNPVAVGGKVVVGPLQLASK